MERQGTSISVWTAVANVITQQKGRRRESVSAKNKTQRCHHQNANGRAQTKEKEPQKDLSKRPQPVLIYQNNANGRAQTKEKEPQKDLNVV